jgi:restriction system protein
MLGAKSMYAEECFKGNFIGADYGIHIDLTHQLPDNWREFNQKIIPIWMRINPSKSKVAAGLSCGALWTVSKGIKIGDIVLCPNGSGSYYVGEILDTYSYHTDQILPHRRTVKWYSKLIDRSNMSDNLKKSTGSIGTVSDITKYGDEIEQLIGGVKIPTIISTDETVEDPSNFALEKHLEDFLVTNWTQTELGKNYDIFQEDGELVGQQYPSDTGPIDILAVSKNKKELLINTRPIAEKF